MLNADRALKTKLAPRGVEFGGYVAAGFVLYRGSITAVCADGTLVPAGAVNTPSPLAAILGIAQHQQINTAHFPAQGAFVGPKGPVNALRGVYALPFDAAPTWADKGKPVYAIDDETVSLTQTSSGGTARLQVGTLAGIDVDGTPYTEI